MTDLFTVHDLDVECEQYREAMQDLGSYAAYMLANQGYCVIDKDLKTEPFMPQVDKSTAERVAQIEEKLPVDPTTLVDSVAQAATDAGWIPSHQHWFCTYDIERKVVGWYRTLAEAESNLFRGAGIFTVVSPTPPVVGTPLSHYGDIDQSDWTVTAVGEEAQASKLKYELETSVIERAACAAHEVNRAYCMSHNDFSQDLWLHAPEWQKNSARMGVKAIMDQPSITPVELHNKWWAQKIVDGWKYGPVKDAEKKEHPCMVDYSELPANQQVKDSLFHLVVRSHLQVDNLKGTPQ